ncbi:MAG: DNA ligase, partial [Chloroflexi bacterium]
MALDTYREKRRFERTPEPEGGDEGRVGPLRFTVQKHRASHLHYDFRLEMDGVLKSWAVPKGPSLNPEDKRLAMMVEDHPLDYRLFEGVIPKGSYGAGTVMVWDEGVYLPRQPAESREENERNLLHGLHKGHITFLVEGTKLHGEFALVKIQRDEKNSWLLLKKGDQYAGTNDVLEEDRSSISGRTMDEIATQSASAGDVWRTPGKRVEIDLSDAPTLDMPHHIAPMLATPAANPFDRAGWLFEIKWDGYRAIAEIEGKNVNLYSRSKRPFDDIYTPIVRSLHAMANEAVLDGELVVLDDNSKPRFQLLQNYATERKGTLAYYVFDVLYLDGHDLRPLPLRRRKEILRRILPAASNIRFSDHVEERGKDFYALAAQQSLEGVVAKRADSRYLSGRRTAEWVKIKTEQRQDAVIAGFTAPRGSRHDLGALVLGVYEADELIYIGHSGTGMDEATLSDLRARLEPLIRETPAFKTRPKTNAPAQWVEPRLVCSVSFKEWTRDGTMRHPVFMGLREDVAAEGVHRESGPEDEPAVEDTALIDADPESAPPHTTREEPHANGSTPSSAVPTPAAADLVPAVPTAGQEDETPDSPNPSPRIPSSSPQTPTGRTFKLLKKQERETEIDGRLLKLTNLDKPYWPADGYKKRDLIAYYREVAPVVLPYLR